MDEEDMNKIATTLEATTTVLGSFTAAGGFVGAIAKLSTVGGPLLVATAQLLTIVLDFGAQQSPELNKINKVYNRMNTRFDQMSDKLNEISHEIVWSRTHIPFGKIERELRSNIRLLNTLYYSPPSSHSYDKAEFLKSYDSSYGNAGWKLFDAMVNSDHVFQTNIPLAVMKYTKNDRQKVQSFMKGIIKLLYDCYKLEIAYLQLSNNSIAVRNVKINRWERRMWAVYVKVVIYDRQVESKWKRQSEEDFDTLAAANVDLNNKDFFHQVRGFLVAKYPWRRWFVVVYDAIKGSDKYVVHVRGGFSRSRVHGRNMIVASKSKAETRMDLANAKSAVANRMVDRYRTRGWSTRWTYKYYEEAWKAFNVNINIITSVPNFSIVGVVKRYEGLCWNNAGTAISSRKKFNFFLMG